MPSNKEGLEGPWDTDGQVFRDEQAVVRYSFNRTVLTICSHDAGWNVALLGNQDGEKEPRRCSS